MSKIKDSSGSLDIFGRIFLPGFVFASVAIGGGYATGREAVEYGAKYGALGAVSGLVSAILVGVLAILILEMCRKYELFDYRSLLESLVGPLYWVYDVAYIFIGIIFIAVLTSATGSASSELLGLNYWVGVVFMATMVALGCFYGERFLERFSVIGTSLLIPAYVIFGVIAIYSNWHQMAANMAEVNHSLYPDVSVWRLIETGLVYGFIYLALFPGMLLTAKRLRRRRDSVISGTLLGVLTFVPWFLTYFALMGFYPSSEVFDAPIPWLVMLAEYGLWTKVPFTFILIWTVIATAIGLIFAVLVRVDRTLEEAGREPMPRKMRAVITLIVLSTTVALSQIGIIGLVAKGYTAAGYIMIVVFGAPLLLRGTYLIFFTHSEEQASDSD